MAGTWWLIEEVGTSKHTNHSLFAISTRDLTRRSTLITRSSAASLSFQLTTSRGGRPEAMSALALHLHFNSRPHEEVDIIHHNTIESMYKYFNSRPRKEVDVANGDHWAWAGYFNSRPRKEVDRAAWSRDRPSDYFNSRPHEEVDAIMHLAELLERVSTHDLTKRST